MADIDKLTSVYTGILSFNYWWILWIAIIGLVVAGVVSVVRNKTIYKYPVRVFKTRENGSVKEFNYEGGYIGRKNSASFFRIKLGWFPWQIADLNTTPNPKFMDQDDRVYYKQIDLGTYVQLQRKFARNVVEFTSVEQDVKYGAVLDIQKIKEVLRTDSVWKKIAPYFALVLIFIFGILAFWFVTNGKCPSIG